MESQEQIARLWDKITARIAADGGVLHRSSFEQEVAEWLVPEAPSPQLKAGDTFRVNGEPGVWTVMATTQCESFEEHRIRTGHDEGIDQG